MVILWPPFSPLPFCLSFTLSFFFSFSLHAHSSRTPRNETVNPLNRKAVEFKFNVSDFDEVEAYRNVSEKRKKNTSDEKFGDSVLGFVVVFL